jgi:thioredoxin 1
MTVSVLFDADRDSALSATSGVVVVDVWAAWCTPCRALSPLMDRLGAEYAGRAAVYKLDADANPDAVAEFDVRALPTVLIFRDGALLQRLVGAQSYGVYQTAVDAALGGAAPEGAAPVPAAPSDEATVRAATLLDVGAATLVFKHSNSCPVSFTAKREYDRFVADHPHIPTHLVVVQQERAVSQAIARLTHVEHASPQALIVRQGTALWHTSHGGITAARLEEAFAKLAADAPAL